MRNNFQLLCFMADMFKIGYRIAQHNSVFKTDKQLGEEGHIHAKALLSEYYELRAYADADDFANELLKMHKKAYGKKPRLEAL